MDLGCGTGRHTLFLAQNNFNVIATGISETGIETTRSKTDAIGLKNI
jgi:2-polyprenyl-3-methyl-5-hydroxy-6-metoxy-1,4-benzoquinol methylase